MSTILDDLKPGVFNFFWSLYKKKNFENTIYVFYKCQNRVLTIGVGYNAEDLDEVRKWPFVKIDKKTKTATSEPASPDDIKKEWDNAKKNIIIQQASHISHGQTYFKPARIPEPKIMLDPEKIDVPFRLKNIMHLNKLKQRTWYQAFLTWPADAQLGILAIAYGGPGLIVGYTDKSGKYKPGIFRKVPYFCKNNQFDKAADECLHAPYGKNRDRINFFAKCFKSAHNVRIKDKGKKSENILHVCSYFPDLGKDIFEEGD